MIDINELRRLALDGDLAAMQEIIHRLEAAETEVESLRQEIAFRDDIVATLAVLAQKYEAEIEAMKRQEMERELAGEYYRQYTTPNQGAKP